MRLFRCLIIQTSTFDFPSENDSIISDSMPKIIYVKDRKICIHLFLLHIMKILNFFKAGLIYKAGP